MRKLVMALILVMAALATVPARAFSQDSFDFGDMPPLPPPLLDDSPAPPPLAPPMAESPAPPLLEPPGGITAPASAPAASEPEAPSIPAMTSSPLAPPPLAPPPMAATDMDPVDLPGEVSPSAPPQTSEAPAVPETPRPAKISGGRVNVRAGPNTQYESIAVLTTGVPVTVLAKNGDWFKIVFPADQLASIHKNFVTADISGEIPEEGVPGVVNTDDADVHAYYWDKSTVVGKLNKGDPVIIKQERGQWYRIEAPESARAYVFAEYVRVDGGQEVAVDSAPPPANPAVDLSQGKPDATGRLKLSDNDRRAAELKEAYFKRLQEQQVREEEQAAEQVSRLEQALNDLEAQLAAVDAEYGSQLSYQISTTTLGSAAWAPPDPLYGGFTGWVENIGRVGGAPASFRLTKGGEVRFYLRSDRLSLAEFSGRRVWVNGNIELASGANASVLNVDQIRILTDQEIAEGMRQFEHSSAQVQAISQPYADYEGYYSYPDSGAVSGGYIDSSPMEAPSDPSQLPDVVGQGGASLYPSPAIQSSAGEIDSDFYQSPFVSEVGPE